MTEFVLCYKRRSDLESKDQHAFSILRGTKPFDGMVPLESKTESGIPKYCYPEDFEYFQSI